MTTTAGGAPSFWFSDTDARLRAEAVKLAALVLPRSAFGAPKADDLIAVADFITTGETNYDCTVPCPTCNPVLTTNEEDGSDADY